MTRVGIRELKARLSQYIEMVRNGEKIIVTDHNVVVAEIRQPEAMDEHTKLSNILDHLAKKGKITRPSRKPTKLTSSMISGRKKQTKQKDWWGVYEANKEESIA